MTGFKRAYFCLNISAISWLFSVSSQKNHKLVLSLLVIGFANDRLSGIFSPVS